MVGGGGRSIADRLLGSGPIRESVYSLLDNERRRFAIYYLVKHRREGPQSIGALAEQIAAWETGVSLTEVSAEDRKLAYNSLQQFHLPKLADAGMIRFDQEEGTVEITSKGRTLSRVLFSNVSRARAWRRASGALGLAGLIVALGHYAKVTPISALDPLLVLLILSLVLTGVALGHVLHVSLMLHLLGRPPSLTGVESGD